VPPNSRALYRYSAGAHRDPRHRLRGDTIVHKQQHREYRGDMSETETAVEKQRPAHLFRPGQSGNPNGRPRGSRNKLADNFVQDLASAWEQHGVAALEAVARDQPEVLIKVVAQLLPRDLNLNLSATVDAASFAEKFRDAVSLLGNAPPPRLPKLKTIEHENAGKRG
jgi:hypothetical protein